CLRVDVRESVGEIVFVDPGRRDLASQDPSEDIAVVIGICGVDRHDGPACPFDERRVKRIVCARDGGEIGGMASRASRLSLNGLFFEPIQGARLLGTGLFVWLAGAVYCHGYQSLLGREDIGPWSGSLTWSAVAVMPWFALFEWSKQPRSAEATRRPALVLALIA